jgi:2-methylisocitrate lyase-like PEP mutase family enzyme
VTADLEAGYGDTADAVSETMARAVEVGVVGANLEDAAPGEDCTASMRPPTESRPPGPRRLAARSC